MGFGGLILGSASTLAESAYYRFVFWFSMATHPAQDNIRAEHTLFSVGYDTLRGARLHDVPFDKYLAELAHPAYYKSTQQLGTAMRAAGVEVFVYPSARDPARGHCVGLFKPGALAQKRPQQMSQWWCELTASKASFKQVDSTTITTFVIDNFLYDNALPLPV